jgi:uncharacterized membrane protein
MATVGTDEDYENEVNRDPEGTNEVRKCDVLLMTQSQVSHLGQSFVLFCSCLVLLLSSAHHYQIESRKSDEKQSKKEEYWRDFEQPGTE